MSSAPSEPAPPSPSRDEKVLSRRPLRSDRKMVAVMAVLALSVAAVSVYYYQVYRADPTVVTPPRLLKFTLVSGNVVLLFALAFYLLRYLIRLVSERRAGMLGSRFKLKLVATFIGLCLAPALVLYAAAISIIFTAIDRAFSPDTVRIVADAERVAEQFYADAQADLGRELSELAAALPEAPAALASGGDLARLLQPEIARRSLTAIRVVTEEGVVDVAGPVPSALDLGSVELRPDPAAGGYVERRVERGGELYLVAAAPLPGSRGAGESLVVARRIPADVGKRAERLRAFAREHAMLETQRPWLKTEQAILFGSLCLAIILAAFWVSQYVARSITVPIQRLAQGTKEVRRGNLSHVVTWQGRDELADLVEAFNDMARDLRVKAEEVDGKARELQGANEELARVNAELVQRRDHMERLLDTMGAGVLALDPGGRVVVANRAAAQILQLPPSSAVGQHFEQFLAGEPLAELRRVVERGLGSEDLRQSRELSVAFERGAMHLQVVLTAQPDTAGPGVGLLALFEDVTELVRAQKLATWRAVARRIAHEIKNPLTPIQLSAQRILKKYREGSRDLPEALEGGVETIIAEVAGLKQMVDEFSKFARMPEVRPVPGDVNAMLASVRALYEGHERLRFELDLGDVPQVPFDPEQLRRAVVNLVDNAAEATGGRGRITLRSSLGKGRVLRIEVADDGPGVRAADRDKLFLPYFTTKERGTGLGLAIVNRIVTDHDGRVRVEDESPRGARFVIELPLASEVGAGRAPGATTSREAAS